MNKYIFLFISAALLWQTGCEHEQEHHETKTKFLVTSPLKKDTFITREYVCQIHSIQHIELRALERGYLQNIYVDEGQYVKKGQLMFQIMTQVYQAELSKAKAEANFAKIEYLNTKRLADSDIVAPNELALSEAKLAKANAELELAQVYFDFTQVKAPFDGIMDHFHVRLGSLLEEGQLLTTLSDNHKMWVYFNVPESEYLDYKAHFKKDSTGYVRLRLANNKLFKYPGEVTTIEADFNNETGNIAFRATFPNPEELLRHGETGNVIITSPLKQALLIPQKATFEILENKYVYIIDEENIVRSRQINIGEELSHIFVVTGGLKETDKILLEGLRKVRDGDKINFDFQDPAEVISHLDLYAE